jgi:hypothetical protein
VVTKFWDKLVEGLAGQWTAQKLGPALVFWGGGLLAWAWRYGWQPLVDWLVALDSLAAYVALAVGGLLLLTASSAGVTWLQLTILRLVEGYWPWPFRGLRFALARRVEGRLQPKENRWQELADKAQEQRSAEEQDEYARLDAELSSYPVDPRDLMPTRLGNLLRVAEEYPRVRYGLAMSVCWPRLWLILSEGTQTTLADVREQLNASARLLVWGVLFVVWTVWAWWAAPAAVAVTVAAYWAMLSAAGVYGDLLRAAFDLHRFALYEQLRWPLPAGPDGEETHGQQLSEYLFRGTGGGGVKFTTPPKK